MDTGKVEFAPDYKSEITTNIDAYERGQIQVAGERSRLERKVLEAVKVAWIDGLISSTTLNDAVKALVEFESKQETK